jgi:hypothetical protein
LLEAANRYNAHFLILEKDGTPSGLKNVYQNVNAFSFIHYLGEVDGDRIFEVP